MLDKQEPRQCASQPLNTSNQEPLSRSSGFLLTGLNVFRSRTNRSQDEIAPRRKQRPDSNTNTGLSDTEAMEMNHQLVDFQATPQVSSSDTKSMRLWHHLQRLAPKRKSETNTSTVMYSISFYPWKMESRGYYSHPEAAANWVPDTSSSRCQICIAAFTLTRRRHHCRLCGHLVCADCSHDRTYLPFAGGSSSQHRLIKDGAPQRTCRACASTLRNMAAQDDPRVKRFTVAVASVRRRKSLSSATSISSTRSVIEVEVERPSLWLRRTGLAQTNSDIEDEEFFIGSNKELQLEQRAQGTTHHFPLRLSVTRAEELDEVLSARACSKLQSESSGSRQFVISSAWLDQWLQYVRVDSASAEAAVSYASTVHLADRSNKSEGYQRKSTSRYRMSRPPRPGPVSNYRLLDFVNGELVSKPNLQRSRGNCSGGDYRVVSQEVWITFLDLYGGGPSIQIPLNESSNELVLTTNNTTSQGSRPVSQWIISELDDSLPALAGSPSIENYSSATRKGAARTLENQAELVQRQTADSSKRTRETTRKRLVSAASMSSLVTKPSSYLLKPSESPRSSSPSRWKLWEDETSRAQTDTTMYEQSSKVTTLDARWSGSQCTAGDTSSTLAAVSAFANAATLARKRSAVSLSRHSAAFSNRSNGSVLEIEEL